jgi:hypothetical protein
MKFFNRSSLFGDRTGDNNQALSIEMEGDPGTRMPRSRKLTLLLRKRSFELRENRTEFFPLQSCLTRPEEHAEGVQTAGRTV